MYLSLRNRLRCRSNNYASSFACWQQYTLNFFSWFPLSMVEWWQRFDVTVILVILSRKITFLYQKTTLYHGTDIMDTNLCTPEKRKKGCTPKFFFYSARTAHSGITYCGLTHVEFVAFFILMIAREFCRRIWPVSRFLSREKFESMKITRGSTRLNIKLWRKKGFIVKFDNVLVFWVEMGRKLFFFLCFSFLSVIRLSLVAIVWCAFTGPF